MAYFDFVVFYLWVFGGKLSGVFLEGIQSHCLIHFLKFGRYPNLYSVVILLLFRDVTGKLVYIPLGSINSKEFNCFFFGPNITLGSNRVLLSISYWGICIFIFSRIFTTNTTLVLNTTALSVSYSLTILVTISLCHLLIFLFFFGGFESNGLFQQNS